MKTLEEATELHRRSYYLLNCEYCHSDCVADQDDFDKYPVPEKKDHERTWKCPVCGHINLCSLLVNEN